MWQENIDLKNKTSFHIGAQAHHFAQCDSEELLLALWKSIPQATQPYIFGSFTNVLLPDSDLDWVIQMMPNKKLPQPQNNQVIVWAGERMGEWFYFKPFKSFSTTDYRITTSFFFKKIHIFF